MFTDQDILDLDVEMALAAFRAGEIGEITLMDILRFLGLSLGEIVACVNEARLVPPPRHPEEPVLQTGCGGPDGGIARTAAVRSLGDPSVTFLKPKDNAEGVLWLFRA